MYTYSKIRHVHLEISTRCNAACPGCPRNYCGVDIRDDYPLHDMSLSEAQTIFQPVFLKQLREILINGNLGDFITAKDGVEIVKYFKSENPKLRISISTNAGIKKTIWKSLAEADVTVLFCLDGLADTHHLYRQQIKWDTVIDNAKDFILHGGSAVWKMILFDHNKHQVDACKKLSEQLGFKNFELIDHGRNKFTVFTQKKQFSHVIGNHNDWSTDWNEMHKRFEDFLISTSGATKDNYQVENKQIICQANKQESIYISATGDVFPCCWTGFYPGSMHHFGNDEIRPLITCENNANKVGIEKAMLWFDNFQSAWISSSQPYLCNAQCGVTR